jgi:hypothetical protein
VIGVSNQEETYGKILRPYGRAMVEQPKCVLFFGCRLFAKLRSHRSHIFSIIKNIQGWTRMEEHGEQLVVE